MHCEFCNALIGTKKNLNRHLKKACRLNPSSEKYGLARYEKRKDSIITPVIIFLEQIKSNKYV